jgi:Ca2+-binding EF-hand superfamily protein
MMMARMPLMMALDADGNGEISSSEIEGAVAALKKLDKNSDGKLTMEELMPEGMPGGFPGGFPGGGDPAEMVTRIMAMDTNKDGFVDKDEAPERMVQGMFPRADSNGDGKLSKEELTKFAAQMGGPRPGGNAPRGGEEGGERPRRPASE